MQISYGFSLVNGNAQQGDWRANTGVNGISDQYFQLDTALQWTWAGGVPLLSRGQRRDSAGAVVAGQQFGADVFTSSVQVTSNVGGTPVTIWTPFTDRRFVLLGVTVSFVVSLAAAGAVTLTLFDDVTAIWGMQALAGTALTATALSVNFDGGYVATSPNNVLQGLLTTHPVTGSVTVSTWGVEIS